MDIAKRIISYAVALAGLLVVAAGCNDNTNRISCSSAEQCPNELLCDTAREVCVDPDSNIPYECDPGLPGCSCDDRKDDPVVCRPDGLVPGLVASCRTGRSTCQDGVYDECVLVTNNNCGSLGVSSGGFKPGKGTFAQVTTGSNGELILDPALKQAAFRYLWVANTGDNTVSKLDIETGREVARYPSVRTSSALGVPQVPSPGGYPGDHRQNNCGNCPSSTAIDFKGDAFVANRAFNRQGTVTKFANELADCIDRNGNMTIDTSTDGNGDGRIDIDDPGEFIGESDECILWTVPVGDKDGRPRSIAIDAGSADGSNGNVWVGLHEEYKVVQLAGDTGEPILRNGSPVEVTLIRSGNSVKPYSAIVDGNGYAWLTGVNEPAYLAQVDTLTGQLVDLHLVPYDDDGCSKGYAITVDSDQRVWLGGWDCRDVKAYDQVEQRWYGTDLDGLEATRGVAVDNNGYVWVSLYDNRVVRLRADDIIDQGNSAQATVYVLPQLPGNGGKVHNTAGVGIDRNGACWVVSSNDYSPLGTATRITVSSGGEVSIDPFPVGHRPYTYSDFTGFGLASRLRPNGSWRGAIEGCATLDKEVLTEWAELVWTESEPAGTAVRLRVRGANIIDLLGEAEWRGPFDTSPVDLEAAGVMPSRYMEVEVQMTTREPGATPSFDGFTVSFTCPGTVISD
ncbi:MAG: hypothetical protein MJE77_27905 [Proteobacteria bacterium]|nr:hypothetical protein [Pseudomonadota bacterium]